MLLGDFYITEYGYKNHDSTGKEFFKSRCVISKIVVNDILLEINSIEVRKNLNRFSINE